MTDSMIASTNLIKKYVVDSEVNFEDIALDWLSFTFLPEVDNSLVITDPDFPSGRKKLPIDLFFELFGSRFTSFVTDFGVWSGKGKHYYSRCISVKCPSNNDLKLKGYTTDFQILYCVPDDGINTDYAYRMGVNVSIPSHFLRAFFKLIGFDFDNIKEFFIWSKNHNIKFSRIDICWDDFSMTYTPHDYARDWMAGNIVSNYSKCEFITSEQTQGGTFALGSRDTKYMRIYDKNFESKGSVPAIRYEFMYTDKWARSFAEIICLNNLKIDFKSLILDWFRVVGEPFTYNFYKEKKDSPTRQDWLEFLKHKFSEQLQVVKVRPRSCKDFKRLNMNYARSCFRYVYTFQTLFGHEIYDNELALIRGKPDNFTPSLKAFYDSLIVSSDYVVDNYIFV